MKILLISMAIIAVVFLSGCSEEKPKEILTGCQRFSEDVREDCIWCEQNGGKYLFKSSFSVECIFPPKN